MANVNLRYVLRRCVVRNTNLIERRIGVGGLSARFKSDEPKRSEIVIEKEKPRRSWKLSEVNWNMLPKKLARVDEYLREGTRHPMEQRGKGRYFRDDEILYCFRDESDLENWTAVTDAVYGGKSYAEFVQGENGATATFRGYISQRLPRYMLPSTYNKLENKPYYRGFANLETLPFLVSRLIRISLLLRRQMGISICHD